MAFVVCFSRLTTRNHRAHNIRTITEATLRARARLLTIVLLLISLPLSAQIKAPATRPAARGAEWLVVHEHLGVPMGMMPQKR